MTCVSANLQSCNSLLGKDMIYLPPSLANFHKLCGSENRFALNSIRIHEPANGQYRIEASDARILGIVRGPNAGDAFLHELEKDDPCGYMPIAAESALGLTDDKLPLIPVAAWKKAFSTLRKDRKDYAKHMPLGLVISGNEYHIGTPWNKHTGEVIDGRWPNVDGVLPKKLPAFSIKLNPARLVKLVQIASQFSKEGPADDRYITLHIYPDKNTPVGITANDGAETFFDGLIMPLSD